MDVVIARPFVFCDPNIYFSVPRNIGINEPLLRVRAQVEKLTQPLWLPEIDRFSDHRVVKDVHRMNAELGW